MSRPTIEEMTRRAEELAAKFEGFDPAPEDFNRPLPPVMAVRLAAWRRDVAEQELADAIQQARQSDTPWRVLGEAVGC